LVSVMVDAKDEFEEADLKLDHESSKNPADPMSDIPWDAKVGGGKAPDKDAFDKAVEEVNDIFSAAGIEIDSDIQEDMFLEVYRRVADDDRTENVVKGNTVEEIMNSRNFENIDRKSTRLNSSHVSISYAVFCLKKKNIQKCDR